MPSLLCTLHATTLQLVVNNLDLQDISSLHCSCKLLRNMLLDGSVSWGTLELSVPAVNVRWQECKSLTFDWEDGWMITSARPCTLGPDLNKIMTTIHVNAQQLVQVVARTPFFTTLTIIYKHDAVDNFTPTVLKLLELLRNSLTTIQWELMQRVTPPDWPRLMSACLQCPSLRYLDVTAMHTQAANYWQYFPEAPWPKDLTLTANLAVYPAAMDPNGCKALEDLPTPPSHIADSMSKLCVSSAHAGTLRAAYPLYCRDFPHLTRLAIMATTKEQSLLVDSWPYRVPCAPKLRELHLEQQEWLPHQLLSPVLLSGLTKLRIVDSKIAVQLLLVLQNAPRLQVAELSSVWASSPAPYVWKMLSNCKLLRMLSMDLAGSEWNMAAPLVCPGMLACLTYLNLSTSASVPVRGIWCLPSLRVLVLKGSSEELVWELWSSAARVSTLQRLSISVEIDPLPFLTASLEPHKALPPVDLTAWVHLRHLNLMLFPHKQVADLATLTRLTFLSVITDVHVEMPLSWTTLTRLRTLRAAYCNMAGAANALGARLPQLSRNLTQLRFSGDVLFTTQSNHKLLPAGKPWCNLTVLELEASLVEVWPGRVQQCTALQYLFIIGTLMGPMVGLSAKEVMRTFKALPDLVFVQLPFVGTMLPARARAKTVQTFQCVKRSCKLRNILVLPPATSVEEDVIETVHIPRVQWDNSFSMREVRRAFAMMPHYCRDYYDYETGMMVPQYNGHGCD